MSLWKRATPPSAPDGQTVVYIAHDRKTVWARQSATLDAALLATIWADLERGYSVTIEMPEQVFDYRGKR